MVNTNNAQEWLNRTISVEQQRRIEELYIWSEDDPLADRNYPNAFFIPKYRPLVGNLDLRNFSSLKRLVIAGQGIENLSLTNSYHLKELNISDNLLRHVVWPQVARGNNLTTVEYINLANNNFYAQDLLQFSQFPNLHTLLIGTNNIARISRGIYNRFYGSLEPLKDLEHLVHFDINATDVSVGLEHLPTGRLETFVFGSLGRSNAGVINLQNTLTRDLALEFEENETPDSWATAGTFPTPTSSDESYEKIHLIAYWQLEQERLQTIIEDSSLT